MGITETGRDDLAYILNNEIAHTATLTPAANAQPYRVTGNFNKYKQSENIDGTEVVLGDAVFVCAHSQYTGDRPVAKTAQIMIDYDNNLYKITAVLTDETLGVDTLRLARI